MIPERNYTNKHGMEWRTEVVREGANGLTGHGKTIKDQKKSIQNMVYVEDPDMGL